MAVALRLEPADFLPVPFISVDARLGAGEARADWETSADKTGKWSCYLDKFLLNSFVFVGLHL